MNSNKVLLIILDGWGINKKYPGNAIELARKPFYDRLVQEYPHAQLETSGETVGLPPGQMGTSEVNHFTIGAGRVEFQDLVRINKAIKDEDFFNNETLVEACQQVKKNNSALHIMGCLSDGGVHSHIEHIKALVKLAKQQQVSQLYLHIFTDGRDTAPDRGLHYTNEIQVYMDEVGLGKIASVVGRYYAMDRDHNWERIDLAYDLLTKGTGEIFPSAQAGIEFSYQNGVTDEFIKPIKVDLGEKEIGTIQKNDAVIFANYRNDRPRQLTERFLTKGPHPLFFVTMTRYSQDYAVKVAFKPQPSPLSLGQVVSEAGLQQLRITETEKFPHVTFFFNCKREDSLEGEDRFMFDSYSDIPTHDEKPYMRTPDIAKHIVKSLETQQYDLIVSNWCNADMVGHTGNIQAATAGCETIDQALAQVIPIAQEQGYHVIITADHGNADEMLDEDGSIITSHSLKRVPFIIISDKVKKLTHSQGTLIDIAPTILDLLELPTPETMTGTSFVE